MSYAWFLPISHEVCVSMLSAHELTVSQLSQPELAALVFLQNLPKLSGQAQAPENLEKIFAQTIQIPIAELQTYLQQKYDNSMVSQGIILAAQFAVHFMAQGDVLRKGYLHDDGTWNFSYSQQRRRSATPFQMVRHDGALMDVSEGQKRFLDAVLSMPEENVRSQSLAGTGKTAMIYELIERIAVQGLKPVTFLADQPQKHQPLVQRMGRKKLQSYRNRIKLQTYSEFAVELLADGNQRLGLVSALRAGYSAALLCERAQLVDHNRIGLDQLADQSWGIVRRYCYSLDKHISEDHISSGTRLRMTKIQAAAAIASARQLWSAMVSLAHPDIPLRGYHIIKMLHMSGKAVPERYGTIMIDELHDAPRVLIEILRLSGLPVLMLGDRYQNFQGFDLPSCGTSLNSDMTVSLRAGPRMADYVNMLIDVHPLGSIGGFSADASKQTEFLEYPADTLPETAAVFPVRNEWGVLALLIRGRRSGRVVDVFDPAGSVRSFIKDCGELFRFGRRSTHGALHRYDSWDALARDMQNNPDFQRVEEWLKRGDVFDLSYTPVPAGYLMGRLANPVAAMLHDVKSLELPVLALPESLFFLAREGSKQELSRTASMLYTGVTRGVKRVYLPSSHKEHLLGLKKF